MKAFMPGPIYQNLHGNDFKGQEIKVFPIHIFTECNQNSPLPLKNINKKKKRVNTFTVPQGRKGTTELKKLWTGE